MINFEDLTGHRFGNLTVAERVGTDKTINVFWICKCDCGNTTLPVTASALKSGFVEDCGHCVKSQAKKHYPKITAKKTRLYNTWCAMKVRCYNQDSEKFNRYGGRGITVCEEWKNSFQAFYEWAMSHGYSDELTIDRIDNDGNYEPSNCRWITNKEQQNNRSNNKLISYNGKTLNISQWAELTNIPASVLYCRIYKYGWDFEKAINTPLRHKKKNGEKTKKAG